MDKSTNNSNVLAIADAVANMGRASTPAKPAKMQDTNRKPLGAQVFDLWQKKQSGIADFESFIIVNADVLHANIDAVNEGIKDAALRAYKLSDTSFKKPLGYKDFPESEKRRFNEQLIVKQRCKTAISTARGELRKVLDTLTLRMEEGGAMDSEHRKGIMQKLANARPGSGRKAGAGKVKESRQLTDDALLALVADRWNRSTSFADAMMELIADLELGKGKAKKAKKETKETATV